MALVKCKECKKEVSSSAKVCPHCGIKNPAVTAKDYIFGLIGVVIIFFVIKSCTGDDSKSTKKVEEKSSVEKVRPREIGEAKPYTIISGNMKSKDRKEIFFVAAPLAETKGDRAATARRAASDIFEKTGIPVVTVFVEHDKLFVAKGNNLAKATYFSDACNFSGKDCNGIVWDVAASNVTVTEKEWDLYRDWLKNRSRFLDKKGNLNEEKLSAFLAKKYGVSPSEIILPAPSIDYVGVNPYESEQDKKVEKDKAFAKKSVIEARIKRLESQFSPWDGSHRSLERAIQKSMNDPDSYEHVETTYRDMGDSLIVSTTFRGKNGFGAVVKNTVVAQVDLDGNILSILSE